MKSFAVVILLLMSGGVQAQHFVESQSLKLNKSIVETILASADFNNDGLPDVLMFTTDLTGIQRIQFIKNDSIDGFVQRPVSKEIVIDSFSGYSLIDYDRDNDIDLVLYSNSTAVYLNQGSFNFLKETVALPAFTLTRWVDLDNNGSQEIVGSFSLAGESVTAVYEQQVDGTWMQKGDNIKLSLSALEVLDANEDGYKDLFISGTHNADSLFTGYLINEKEFRFTPFLGKAFSGQAAAGDLNADGIFDVAFIGLDSVGNTSQKAILSKNGKYVIRDTAFTVSSGSIFISDLNADGQADISAIGKTNSADTVHSIMFADGSSEVTSLQRLKSQQFLDFNRDGNLDMVRATKPDSIHITFYTNQSAPNQGPDAPEHTIANKIFNRYFLFWSPSSDDHTVSESITYDLFIQGNQVLQPADFDLQNERKLTTSHGNNLTQTFKLFDEFSGEPSGFAIQGVDNAFQAAFVPGTGLCVGTINSSCPLLESQAELIQVCPSESVTLEASTESHWFSFRTGYLGAYTDLSFTAVTSDTLFYYDPTVFDCEALKAFVIEVREVTDVEYVTRYACEDEIIEFETEANWQSVQWSSDVRGDLGQSGTLQYKASVNDTIFSQLTGNGCGLLRKIAIRISKPEITVEHEHLAILKGNTVQLQAYGGERYSWSSAATLSDAAIANPIASPVSTTTYTVTGYDSINCSAHASVTVTVESAGFVPNLFTPNDDGQNDELKIYGLREAEAFSFTIYNREGKVVYETQSTSAVISTGWDGRRNGLRQPAGVYFWKVRGRHPSGEAVKLNGKSEGSIILVR